MTDDAETVHQAAWQAMGRGDLPEALRLAGVAARAGRSAAHLETLGQFQYLAGQTAAAVSTLRAAVSWAPQSPSAHGALAMALRAINDPALWSEAGARIKTAVALAPDMAAAQANLVLILHHVGAADDAVIAAIQRACRLDPGDPGVRADAAATLFDRGLFSASRRAAEWALCLAPDMALATHAQAEAIAASSGWEAALVWFDRLVALDPSNPLYRVARGKARLGYGDAVGGWADYEARRGMPAFGIAPAKPGDSQPQPLVGRTILVQAEQGFGDVLQFIRYVPVLCQRAARVFVVAQPALHRLLLDMPGCAGKLALADARASFDLTDALVLPVMSLPRLLDIPPDGAPYLAASQQQRDRWSAGLSEVRGLRVGVCWSGNPRLDAPVGTRMTDRRRSVPLAEFGQALQSVTGAAFISLQHSYRKDEVPSAYGIRDASAYINDFSDLAGLIANLDLVITVDTAVAHLAGGMGTRTWMLNRFDSCWRWNRGCKSTHWYDSMTIFSQTRPMSWAEPLASLVQSLQDIIRQR